MQNTEKTMEKLVALCKNRGFIYAGSEIYGGPCQQLGLRPARRGAQEQHQEGLVEEISCRENPYNVGLDSAILMNPQVWVASGHVTTFNDPLIDCKSCKSRHRADKLIEDWLAENPLEGVSAEA